MQHQSFGFSGFGWPVFGGGSSSGPPSKPRLTVSGGVVSTFNRGGVDYTQILWRQSGSMGASGLVAGARFALVAGGANGGRAGGNQGPGGGAGGECVQRQMDLPIGITTITIGAGASGAAVLNNQPGLPGSSSTLTGALNVTANGGGQGGGGTEAIDGGPNGGGGRNRGLGGAKPPEGFKGGDGCPAVAGDSSAESGGGGAGAGGPGKNGTPNLGGDGGPGVVLSWMDSAITVGAGGGGGPGGNTSNTPGNASDGGVPGGSTTRPNGINGGGVGGANRGANMGNGGDGLFVLVFPSSNATVVTA